MIKKLINKILTLLRGKIKTIKDTDLVFVGTEYGGWKIPQNSLSEVSICYLCGAGEDISFDIEIVEKYKCQVYIFDPTPRSKSHFNLLIEQTKLNKKFAVNNSKTNFYPLNYINIELLNFRELGLWYKKDEVKFYIPKNADEISHSALNDFKKSENYFLGKVNRLSKIMEDEGHQHIDLLKIDIEGSEYDVIDSIIKDNVKIKTICVEFHEPTNNIVNRIFQIKTKQYIKKLIAFGYCLVHYDDRHNFTFVNNSF